MISFNHKIYHHFKKLNEKNEKKCKENFVYLEMKVFFFFVVLTSEKLY